MKKYQLITIISIFGLLSACSSLSNFSTRLSTNSKQSNPNQNLTANISNCPAAPTTLPEIKVKSSEEFGNFPFNIAIDNIITDMDTIRFKSEFYEFVFCRANKNWTIELARDSKPAEITEDFNNPDYKTIVIAEKTYQYRVLIDGIENASNTPQQVIFELKTPENSQPQRQVLYTVEQMRKAEAGYDLGVPEVTATVNYNQHLFWAISPEQGEGFGGIATLVSYNPETQSMTVIQPDEIKGQQINDLAIAGDPQTPTFWIATQMSGEGNPYLPSLGLVAYRPNSPDYTSGTTTAYGVYNSPMVGAIPQKLQLDGEQLWIATGNGICQVKILGPDNPENWECWRLAMMAKLPPEGVPIYPSFQNKTPETTLTTPNPLEVLWLVKRANNPSQGRYEVRYEPGFTIELQGKGATSWSEWYGDNFAKRSWESPVYWIGSDWHWQGDRFVRGLDEVPGNFVGGGPQGISPEPFSFENPEYYAMRGDLELLELTSNLTKLKYYSGWVDENLLKPYITIVPQQSPQKIQPNPLLATNK